MKNVQIKIRNCDTAVYRLYWLYGTRNAVTWAWSVKQYKDPAGAKKRANKELAKLRSFIDNDANYSIKDTEFGVAYVNNLTGHHFYGYRIVAAPYFTFQKQVDTYDFDCEGKLVGIVRNSGGWHDGIA